MTVRVGLVGLAEAGNYGDDLILIAASQALAAVYEDIEIQYIGFGHPLDWDSIQRTIELKKRPNGVRPEAPDLPGSTGFGEIHRNCDAVIFGGGGLIQTAHHPDRPYHWIRYLPRTHEVPVAAVGLGIGPLSRRWGSRLATWGSPFDVCFVRDQASLDYGTKHLKWTVKICDDFVDQQFLRQLVPENGEHSDGRKLGVALRRWPGLSVEAAAEHVQRVALLEEASSIAFFVLESKAGAGVDVDFIRAVASRVSGFDSEVHIYNGQNLISFSRSMSLCDVAVSMKLHASAVWDACGVPIYPIIYAPKMAAFFGRGYQGLEVLTKVVKPHRKPDSAPRAFDVVREILPCMIESPRRPSRYILSPLQRFILQVRSIVIYGWLRLSRFWRK